MASTVYRTEISSGEAENTRLFTSFLKFSFASKQKHTRVINSVRYASLTG